MSRSMAHATLALLLQQLASAHNRGIPLGGIAAILADDPRLRKHVHIRLATLATDLDQGASLVTALENTPRVVSVEACEFLRVAGDGEKLSSALSTLAADFDIRSRTDGVYRLAWIWPTAVLAVLAVAFILNGIFIVPALQYGFRETHTELPTGGASLFAVSDFLIGYPLLVMAIFLIAAAVLGWRGLWPAAAVRGLRSIFFLLPAARRFYACQMTSRIANVLQQVGESRELRDAGFAFIRSSAAAGRDAAVLISSEQRLSVGQSAGNAFAPARATFPRIYLFCRLADATGDQSAAMAQLANLAAQDEVVAAARFERALILVSYLVVGSLVAAFVISMYSAIASIPNFT